MNIMKQSDFLAICKEHDRLLEIIGNVEDNEVIALVLLAAKAVKS